MTDEDEVGGRSLDECEALYRAAISCAGLLFLVLAECCLLCCVRVHCSARERDIDQVLSSSFSSSAMPPRGSVLKIIPYRFLRSGVLSCLGCLGRPTTGGMGCWGMGLLM